MILVLTLWACKLHAKIAWRHKCKFTNFYENMNNIGRLNGTVRCPFNYLASHASQLALPIITKKLLDSIFKMFLSTKTEDIPSL